MKNLYCILKGIGFVQQIVIYLFGLFVPLLMLGLFHVSFIYLAFGTVTLAVSIIIVEELVQTLKDG